MMFIQKLYTIDKDCFLIQRSASHIGTASDISTGTKSGQIGSFRHGLQYVRYKTVNIFIIGISDLVSFGNYRDPLTTISLRLDVDDGVSVRSIIREQIHYLPL